MGIETEINSRCACRSLRKLAASRSLRAERRRTRYAPSSGFHYFDTPKHLLRRNGISLRGAAGRQEGISRPSRPRQTASRSAAAEWEHALPTAHPDLRAAHDTPLQQLLSRSKRRKLDAVFATHVHRTVVPLPRATAAFELALDEGHIRAGLYSRRWRRLSLSSSAARSAICSRRAAHRGRTGSGKTRG